MSIIQILMSLHSIKGPVAATKVSLQCKECHTNYNHTFMEIRGVVVSSYNYAEEAPLVDVITYAQCSLQQWFLCLR